MGKKYFFKLYDDTTIDFTLISKDVFEELVKIEDMKIMDEITG